jgi:Flp pilus assembly protein TadD
MGDLPVVDRAREALRLAEVDPGRAADSAAAVVETARSQRCSLAESIAERGWGLALRHSGELDNAIRHLRRAVQLANRTGAAEATGEARMTLAFALAERGQPNQAIAQITQALESLTGVAHARALAQRGTIELELGHHADAEAS